MGTSRRRCGALAALAAACALLAPARAALAPSGKITQTGQVGYLVQSMQCSSETAMVVDGASWLPPSAFYSVRRRGRGAGQQHWGSVPARCEEGRA